jgi:hypothetical protein
MCNILGRTDMHTGFCLGNFKGRANLVNLGVNWRVTLKLILNKWDEGDVGWIHLAQHMDK